MEYASGGELFERIRNAGRFSEDEARFFFQQLVSGVSYRHAMVNKRVYCFQKEKSNVVPEVLKKEYDGKIADVWSCGVTLYFMLVGAYPFEDPDEPKNFCRTIHRILNLQYSIPDYVHISPECHHLISRIFTADPAKRITMAEIRNHEWFLKNLPVDLVDENTTSSQFKEPDQPAQSVDEVMQIIAEGTIPAAGANSLNQNLTESLDIDGDDVDEDLETDPDLEVDSSWEIVYAQ